MDIMSVKVKRGIKEGRGLVDSASAGRVGRIHGSRSLRMRLAPQWLAAGGRLLDGGVLLRALRSQGLVLLQSCFFLEGVVALVFVEGGRGNGFLQLMLGFQPNLLVTSRGTSAVLPKNFSALGNFIMGGCFFHGETIDRCLPWRFLMILSLPGEPAMLSRALSVWRRAV
jgi:hypothetical protein